MRTLVFSLLICSLAASVTMAWTTPVSVGGGVNTLAKESDHCVSYDGLTMYFSRVTNGVFRLYQATRASVNDEFGTATLISGIYSVDGGNVAGVWVSADNLRLYYYAREWYDKTRLKMSTRSSTADAWQNGQNITELNNLGNLGGCTLSSDELTMVFSSSSLGGEGLSDLFIATRTSRTSAWGNVRNLSELNTAEYNHGASLSPDGLTLYYATINSAGNKAQTFKATRVSVDDQFGTPELLPFSSDFSSPAISADGKALYLGVNPGQLGNWDIYVSYNNTAPVADAGDDQVVYAGIDGSAKVVLDGSDSSDPQNDELEYTWSYTVNGQVYEANGVNPTLALPAGTHTITLVVNDGEFDSEADEVVVEVIAALKVKMKLSPVLHKKSSKLLIARFDFPNKPVGKIEPYSIALAADPNIAVDYVNLTAYKDSILNCDVAFESASIPSSLLASGAKVVIFGYFKSGQIFYGEDRLVQVYKKK